MAKNFLDEEEKIKGMSYTDGFRFGFGFFIAQLLGVTVLGLIALGVTIGMHRLH
jgi:hypothetical protein